MTAAIARSAGRPSRQPSRGAGYRRAVRIVSRWAAFYTRDLQPAVAADRRDELASDLWEQGADADARGTSGIATSTSILWRAARGIPADLSWRRRIHGTAGSRSPEWRGWSGRGSVAAALIVAAATLACGVVTLAVIWSDALHERPLPSSALGGSVSLSVLICALICGMLLLLRRRTRWLGAGWVGLAAPVVLFQAMHLMVGLSATFQWYVDGLMAFGPAAWRPLSIVFLAAIVLFYASLAIAWLPSRSAAETSPTGGTR